MRVKFNKLAGEKKNTAVKFKRDEIIFNSSHLVLTETKKKTNPTFPVASVYFENYTNSFGSNDKVTGMLMLRDRSRRSLREVEFITLSRNAV